MFNLNFFVIGYPRDFHVNYVHFDTSFAMLLLLLLLGGVYMISGRLLSRREFTLVPSYGSVFVYMIPTQNVMPARIILARVYPGSCAGARFSSRHENSFRCHVNGVCLFVSYPLKFHQFYGTLRLAPQQTRLYVNTVPLFISSRNERRAVIM